MKDNFARTSCYAKRCMQDTLSSCARRAWPTGLVQPLGRVRRASKGILHTRLSCKQVNHLTFKSLTLLGITERCPQNINVLDLGRGRGGGVVDFFWDNDF